MKPRFLVDEDVVTCLKFILAEWGYDADAVSLRDDLASENDEVILAVATQERRVVITHDEHYEGLHRGYAADGVPHAGIVMCPDISYRNLGLMLHWTENLLKTNALAAHYADQLLYLQTY